MQYIGGRSDLALETQKAFVKDVETIADNVPIVGHVKAVVHLALGDTAKAEAVLKSNV